MPRKTSDNYTRHNKVKIVRGGADYFNAIEEIADNAQYSLHLQTYIFNPDATGTKVADALIRAAKRGVKVYLLVDGYASGELHAAFIGRMTDAGVHFAFFNPFFKGNNFYIGRRLHHKIIVADARVCMVAGINVSDRYNDIGETKAWLDWAIHAEGEVARELNDVCIKTWNKPRSRKNCEATNNPKYELPAGECLVRVRRNDWAFTTTDITNSYRELFRAADKEIVMMTSYFWPPQRLLNRMIAAAKRGVKVRMILTAKADVPFSKNIEKYLYPLLLKNGIEIYEYEPNILHGKVAARDSRWLTAGSYNMNNISAYASVELNLDIENDAMASQLTDKLKEIIKNDCVQVTDQNFSSGNNIFKRTANYLSYRIVHIIFFLFTFYFIQKRKN